MKRHRPTYAVLIPIVIVLGLGSRSSAADQLPAFLNAYAGDTLWALLVFLLIGFLRPAARILYVALATLGFSFAIEVSQLCQTDWLNALRDTWLGAKVLGFGFKWSDLICYSVGCGIGAVAEFANVRFAASAEMSE